MYDKRIFGRVSLSPQQQAVEERKKAEVLRILDMGAFGRIVVHKYRGEIVQIEEQWNHRFPKHMSDAARRAKVRDGPSVESGVQERVESEEV